MCDGVVLLWRAFRRYLEARTWPELGASFLCWVLLIVGSAGRSVFLVKLRSVAPLPSDPFAMEWMADIFAFFFFLVVFLAYYAARRPDLTYLHNSRGIACMAVAAAGFGIAFYLQGYASPHVDPALRHIATLTLVLVTPAMAYFMGTGPGGGAMMWLHAIVFIFCIGGVLLAGAGSLTKLPETMDTNDERAWFAIYIVSFLPQSAGLVAVTYYFKRFLIFREEDSRAASETSHFVAIDTSSTVGGADDDNDDRFDFRAQKRTDPLTGKVCFAAIMAFMQLFATLILSPTDVAPFFGTSPTNVTSGLLRVKDNFVCVFAPSSSPRLECADAYRPFLQLSLSAVAQIVGLMFALQRTPFGAAQAIIFGVTSLAQLLRGSFPEALADPGAKVGTTPVGEAVGAVALSLASVLVTFVAEESARLEHAPRRAALHNDASSSGVTERQPLVDGVGYGAAARR